MIFDKTGSGYILRIKLVPNASRSYIGDVVCGQNGEQFLKIGVVAVPEKGKANHELIELLSRLLKLPKSVLEISAGQTDKWKKISLPDRDGLEARLLQLTKEQP